MSPSEYSERCSQEVFAAANRVPSLSFVRRNLPEARGYLLKESQDVRIAVLPGGPVEREVVAEDLLDGDRVSYHRREYGNSGSSYKHQGGCLPLCRLDHLPQNVKMIAMRVTSNVSFGAIMRVLLANELPDLGNPSITTCLSGVTARVRSLRVRNSQYKPKKTVGWPPA